MKEIISVAGTVAVHVSGDDVLPRRGLLQRDLIEVIANQYQFANRPQTMPGVPAPTLVFQSGFLGMDNRKIPIIQLSAHPDGQSLTASNTDDAALAVDNLMNLLDVQLGYRFSSAQQDRYYSSAVIVEFEQGFISRLEEFAQIQTILNQAISPGSQSYRLRRFSFDLGAPTEPKQGVSVIQTISTEFAIEARVFEPFDRQRFFSIAPVQSSQHIAILARIEEAGLRR